MFKPLSLLTLLVAGAPMHAQAPRPVSANLDPSGITWSLLVPNTGATLRVAQPDGQVLSRVFPAGTTPSFSLAEGAAWGDGLYRFDLYLHAVPGPMGGSGVGEGRDREVSRGAAGPAVSGAFTVQGGVILAPTVPERPGTTRSSAGRSGGLEVHPDVVTPDDTIIQGSLCVGFDCVNNESFGFDTIRLKENNTRIKFDDTSSTAGFPANDWTLVANDSPSGGASYFAIEDATALRMPFKVAAGGPENALYVSPQGQIGLGTSTPVLLLHGVNGNTPGLRLDQTAAGGYSPQVWDVAGNEANFFVRDVTGGSKLPLRIRPGAPTSSLDIASSGHVGIGTASPASLLTVNGQIEILQAGLKFPDGTVQTSAAQTLDAGVVNTLNGQSGTVQITAVPPLSMTAAQGTITLSAQLPPTVSSLNGMKGDVVFEAAAPLSLSSLGNRVLIGVQLPPSVASLNGLSGGVTLAAGRNMRLQSEGNTLTLEALSPEPGDEASLVLMGSTGVPDPGSTGLRFEGGTVRAFSVVAPVSATLRHSIPPAGNLTVAGRPARAFKVRYQDRDGAGSTSQVLLRLHRSDIETGEDRVVWTFDSNQHPATGDDFRVVEVLDASAGTVFVFDRYGYWLETVLSRSIGGAAALGMVRIRTVGAL